MAEYVTVDKQFLENGLEIICNATREKGGTTEKMDFPTAIADAITAIQSGGGKVTTGSITYIPKDGQDLGHSITHGLGVVPKIFAFTITFAGGDATNRPVEGSFKLDKYSLTVTPNASAFFSCIYIGFVINGVMFSYSPDVYSMARTPLANSKITLDETEFKSKWYDGFLNGASDGSVSYEWVAIG